MPDLQRRNATTKLSDQLKQGGVPSHDDNVKPETIQLGAAGIRMPQPQPAADGGFVIRRATKRQARLRLALNGPGGSGKTYTALRVASSLAKDAKIVLIDTEHGTSVKYSQGEPFEFDTVELASFEPRTYVGAIKAVVDSGVAYDVLIIDSLSHAWAGKGGALEQVDMRASASRTGSSFSAWREVTPMHNELVEAILGAPFHVIATMRTKTEYAVDRSDNGKTTVRKLGLAPIQRDGIEYEFDVVGDLSQDHVMTISKTRCPALDDVAIRKPGEELAKTLLAWLGQGEAPLGKEGQERIAAILRGLKTDRPDVYESLGAPWRADHGYKSWVDFFNKGTLKEGNELLVAIAAALAVKNVEPAPEAAPFSEPESSGENVAQE